MTRIDFYILDSPELTDRVSFVHRLLGKTARLGHNIRIQVSDQSSAETLLNQLRAHDNFGCLPIDILERYKNESEQDSMLNHIPPIQISYTEMNCPHHDLLINLSDSPPPFFASFDRLAEVVVQEDSILTQTRQFYRFYQSKNYPMHQHKIAS